MLSLKSAVSTAQQNVSYDDSNYTDILTSNTGDYFIYPNGKDVLANDSNLWVCTGGSSNTNGCPSGTPSGQGNLVVETRLGVGTSTPNWTVQAAGTRPFIGLSDTAAGVDLKHWTFSSQGGNLYIATSTDALATSTIAALTITNNDFLGIGTTSPTEQLSVRHNIFVGSNGVTSMGRATSTFQGDIKIIGKLDVSTIDPPYTIDGVKYATFVPSMTGVKEETSATIRLDTYNSATGKYETRIAFDGKVFYTKDIEHNALVISGTEKGEVSMRLTANRYDSLMWPNLRTDQDGVTEGTHVLSAKLKGGIRSAVAAAAAAISQLR